jgi:hypothetical protein
MTSKLPTTNPFIMKKYYIHESILGSNSPSRIVGYTLPSGNYAQVIGPVNFLAAEKYMLQELNKFMELVNLARRCDNSSQNINIVDRNQQIPQECKTIFKTFNKNTDKIMNQEVISYNETPYGVSHIGPTGPRMFDLLQFTDNYINSKTGNDKKSLTQRLRDLDTMVSDMQNILQNDINTQQNQNIYPENTNNIKDSYSNIKMMRRDLNLKLRELRSGDSTKFGNSKLFLDSTVYTSVLWTILATTMIFYVFKKL